PVPKPGHQLWRRDADLADLLRWKLARALIGIENPDVNVRQRHTDRSAFVPALDRVDAQGHHRLGQRVTFDDAASGHGFEARLRFSHERRRTREANLDRLEVNFAALDVRVIE